MKNKYLIMTWLVIGLAACQQNVPDSDIHGEHGETKFQYTVYSADFELFAEADAFLAGASANVLSHFSHLPDFKALEAGKITMVLTVNGKETRQTLDKPSRKGIYSFNIRPDTPGKGSLKFKIENSQGQFEVTVPEVTVFNDATAADEAAENQVVSKTNTAAFTKEQSWKTDFATGYPNSGPFGQVIKTMGLVLAAPGNEMTISARSAGVVLYSSNSLFEGKEVSNGQVLLTLAGDGLSDNIAVKYAGAKSNFEKAQADYDRVKELAQDKIISGKELLEVKNRYETTRAIFDNLSSSTGESGQRITSPLSGFIKQVFVTHGSYVEAGQALLVVSRDKTLVITAEVPQRYAPILSTIYTANIFSPYHHTTYSFEQLNGKVLSYGKAANPDNFLLPVTLQIDNKGQFIAGSFVDVYLKTLTNTQALTVPVTALLEEQGNYFLYVQVTPELFEKREVHTGVSDGLQIEITGGIMAHERIVTRGAMMIKLSQATGTLDAHSGHVH